MDVTQPSVPSTPFVARDRLARAAFEPRGAYQQLGYQIHRSGEPRLCQRPPSRVFTPVGSPQQLARTATPPAGKSSSSRGGALPRRIVATGPWLQPAEIMRLSQPSVFRFTGGATLYSGRKLQRRPPVLPGFGWKTQITSR